MIRKLRKLASLTKTGYASISVHTTDGKLNNYSLYDPDSKDIFKGECHTFPNTYQELLKDLDERIAILERRSSNA